MGIAFMTGSGILFALMFVLIKSLSPRMSFLELGFFRSFLSLPFLLTYMLITRQSFRLKKHKLMFTRSLIGWLAMLCNFYAVVHIPVADSAILTYTAPIWVFLFAEFYLREKVPSIYWGCLALAFVGVALILQPHMLMFNLGGLVGLLGGALVGGVYLMLKQLNKTEHPSTIVFYFTLYATLLFLPFLPAVWVWPTAMEWLILLAIGALATLAQVWLTQAYRHGKASSISLYNYTSVVASVFWSWVLLGEKLFLNSLLGIAIIIGCVIYISRYEEKLLRKI